MIPTTKTIFVKRGWLIIFVQLAGIFASNTHWNYYYFGSGWIFGFENLPEFTISQ